MEIKSLFDRPTLHEILARINNLSPQSERQWGKMSVSQMLAHCKIAFGVPLSEKKMPRIFLGRLIGWMFKSQLYSERPYPKSSPTAPHFIIKNEPDFYKEKEGLIELVNQFHSKGAGGVGKFPHPFFGDITSEQWGKSMWKHLDHHLRQFGV